MKKHLAIMRITFSNVLRYRFEFFTIQLRAVITLLTLYFLWTAAFANNQMLFGYTQREIVSYVFLATIVRSFILMTVTNEMGTEIGSNNSRFFSYLLKPVGYFSYWFTLDLVGKVFNTSVFLIVFLLLINILHVNIIIASVTNFLLFSLSLIIALILFFFISSAVSFSAFWNGVVWGTQWFLFLIVEFTSGLYFPLTALPDPIEKLVYLTPFPYLLFYPVQILMGKVDTSQAIIYVLGGTLWVIVMNFVSKAIFSKGLSRYEAMGG